MSARPTLRHVALASGVSAPTVSKILNGQGSFSPETVTRVLDTAQTLGYRPNSAARTVRKGHSRIVAAIIDRDATRETPIAPRFFWTRFVDSLIDGLSEDGVGLLVVPSGYPDLVETLPIDGVITVTGRPRDLALARRFGVPVTGFGSGSDFDVNVSHDFESATQTALDYLSSLGGENPALLVSLDEHGVLDQFEHHYRSTCAKAGSEPLVLEFADRAGVDRSVRDAIDSGADGIFVVGGVSESVRQALNDIAAEDVGLVVQSEGLIEAYLRPPVTTLSLCASESAQLVADAIVATLRDNQIRKVVLPHRLDIRLPAG